MSWPTCCGLGSAPTRASPAPFNTSSWCPVTRTGKCGQHPPPPPVTSPPTDSAGRPPQTCQPRARRVPAWPAGQPTQSCLRSCPGLVSRHLSWISDRTFEVRSMVDRPAVSTPTGWPGPCGYDELRLTVELCDLFGHIAQERDGVVPLQPVQGGGYRRIQTLHDPSFDIEASASCALYRSTARPFDAGNRTCDHTAELDFTASWFASFGRVE
jgi:hypothetical protein